AHGRTPGSGRPLTSRHGARYGRGADDRRHRGRRNDCAWSSEDARGDEGRTRHVLSDPRGRGVDGHRRADRRRARPRPLLQHSAGRRPRDRGQPAHLHDRLPGGSEHPVSRRPARAGRAERGGSRGVPGARSAGPPGASLLRPGRVGRVADPHSLKVLHCPVNMAGIPWENVQALKRNGVDARLVTFKYPPHRPHLIDVNLGLDRERRLWRRQLVQWRTFARFLPWADVFHFYFGLTLVPARAQFPILGLTRKKSIYHFLGSDIRGKTPEELAYAQRADARIVGSYDAVRWVPDAEVVPPAVNLDEFEPVP